MKVEIIHGEDGISDVIVIGRMDIAGVTATEADFTRVAASCRNVIVDFTGVDFLASLGMRTLVMTAKALASKGGMMLLLRPQPSVEKALRTAGLDTIIPIIDARDGAASHFK